MLVAAVVLPGGCARPGDGVAGAPEATVRSMAGEVRPSAVPGPVPLSPGRAGGASCAVGAVVPTVEPSASFDVNDPGQRARRALAEQHRPTPRRGVVAEGAAAGAEACVDALRVRFSLVAAGSGRVPDERVVEEALRSAGLGRITVGAGPVFAGSTGGACVYGEFAGAEPVFSIGPVTGEGSCDG